ncbi:MAG: hypothetical protein ABIR30_13595 [Chitinophagaceae bacterium]
MKIIISLFVVALFIHPVAGQKKGMKEKALEEIDSLVANALEFLGKTDSFILAAGRPFSIKGGDKWDAEVIRANKKNSMDVSKTIIIGTGCGALMLMVSAKTGLVYAVTFVPHAKAKLDGADIMSYLASKYSFDQRGNSTFQAKDFSWVSVGMLAGGVMIAAMEEDKKTLRFEH